MDREPEGFTEREREREKNPPLDHAGARIVSELAARLLPPLREALGEVRSQENRDRDEAWRKIREAVSGLGERTDREPQGDAERWERLSASLAEVGRRLSALEERMGGLEAPTPQRDSAPPHPDTREEAREAPLSDLMERRLPAWEGLLRAHNQAQSRELNALSTELSELQNETRNALERTIRETLCQELALCNAQWGGRLEALQDRLREEMRAVRKPLWGALGLGAIAALLLLALLAGFAMP